MSSVNDHYLVNGNTSILNLKNSYNQLVNELQNSNIDNLIINPMMKFFPTTLIPFGWDVSAGITFSDTSNYPNWLVGVTYAINDVVQYNNILWKSLSSQHGNAPIVHSLYWTPISDNSYKVVHFAQNSWIQQTVTKPMQLDSEYVISFDIDVAGTDPQIDVSIVSSSILFLNPSSSVIHITSSGTFKKYFHIKTSNHNIGNIVFKIANVSPTNNSYSVMIKHIAMVKGSIELYSYNDISNFISNTVYDNVENCWKLTHDGGITWNKILTLNTSDNAYIEPKNTLIEMTAIDDMYKIVYPVNATNGLPILDVNNQYIITYSDAPIWNNSISYSVNTLVTHNNLVWKSVTNSNIGNIPNGYSGVWLLFTDKVKVNFSYDFLQYQKAYYSEHIQSSILNGIHIIPNMSKTHRYQITVNNGTVSATLVYVPTELTTTSNSLVGSFAVQHDNIGEHVVDGNKKISLTVNQTTGSFSLSAVTYTPITFTSTNLQNFNNIFKGSISGQLPSIRHNLFCQHIIHDFTESNDYILNINDSATFYYTPITSRLDALTIAFEKFRMEHDKYGRHVLRDEVTGKFYRIYNITTEIFLVECIFEPPTDINLFLSLYNTEHDINGDHVFQYTYNNITQTYKLATGTWPEMYLTPYNHVPLYHMDKIIATNQIFGNLHSISTDSLGHQHKFKIANRELLAR